MHILTPAKIESVAWEGELIPSEAFKAPERPRPPLVTIGRPEVCTGNRGA